MASCIFLQLNRPIWDDFKCKGVTSYNQTNEFILHRGNGAIFGSFVQEYIQHISLYAFLFVHFRGECFSRFLCLTLPYVSQVSGRNKFDMIHNYQFFTFWDFRNTIIIYTTDTGVYYYKRSDKKYTIYFVSYFICILYT